MSRACFFPFFASKGTALALSKPKETKIRMDAGGSGRDVPDVRRHLCGMNFAPALV